MASRGTRCSRRGARSKWAWRAFAAERASDDQIATIAEEVTGMFASLDDAQAFLIHDIRFHRAVAAASGNPILASLVEMVSALFYEQRRKTVTNGRDLKRIGAGHRNIYHAVRAHDAKRARAAMSEHLSLAQQAQALEARRPDARLSAASRRRWRPTPAPAAAGRARLVDAAAPPVRRSARAGRMLRSAGLTAHALRTSRFDRPRAVVIGGTSGIGRRVARASPRRAPTSCPARGVGPGRRDGTEIEALGRRTLRVPPTSRIALSLDALLRRDRRRVRQGRHHDQLRRSHQARADARS